MESSHGRRYQRVASRSPPWELSTKPGHHGRGKASNRLPRKALGCQVLHHPGPKITTKFSTFFKFCNKMKEEAQGFQTPWESIGFPLHPNALWVLENEFSFGKSKLTMGVQNATTEVLGGVFEEMANMLDFCSSRGGVHWRKWCGDGSTCGLGRGGGPV
jgi:hypothetical protein